LGVRELKYLGKIAKNRKVIVKQKSQSETEIRIDEWAKSIPIQEFELVILSVEKQISVEKQKKLWVTT